MRSGYFVIECSGKHGREYCLIILIVCADMGQEFIFAADTLFHDKKVAAVDIGQFGIVVRFFRAQSDWRTRITLDSDIQVKSCIYISVRVVKPQLVESCHAL